MPKKEHFKRQKVVFKMPKMAFNFYEMDPKSQNFVSKVCSTKNNKLNTYIVE